MTLAHFPNKNKKFKSSAYQQEDLNFLFSEILKGRRLLGPGLTLRNHDSFYYFNPGLSKSSLLDMVPLLLSDLPSKHPVTLITNLTFQTLLPINVVLYPIKPSISFYWPVRTLVENYTKGKTAPPMTLLIGTPQERSKVLPLLHSRDFPSALVEELPFVEWELDDYSNLNLTKEDSIISLSNNFDIFKV